MAKITRKAFTRRKIVVGVSVFAGVTLVAAGASVLVLSQPVYFDQTASVNVGTTSTSSSKFVTNTTKIYVTGDETKSSPAIYRFEPEENDNEGRVKYVDVSEVLSLTVETTIDHSERLSSITAQTHCKGTVFDSRLKEAVTKEYIELPESFSFEGNETRIYNGITETPLTDKFHVLKVEDIVVGKSLTFSYDIAFSWGKFFNRKNPGRYFDEDNLDLPTGNANSPAGQDTVVGVLKDLRNLLNGIELDLWFTAK